MRVPDAVLAGGLRCLRPLLASRRASLATRRSMAEVVAKCATTPENTVYDFEVIGQMAVQYVTVQSEPQGTPATIIYLHGGGHVLGKSCSYRPFAAHLSAATGMDVLIPEFPQAPEEPHPAALRALMAMYRDLPRHGVGHSSVVLVGDGSGGGLAMALAIAVRDAGLPMPGAIGLICPWLDLAPDLAGSRIPGTDPLVTTDLMTRLATAYTAGADAADPEVSPLAGNLWGLPPIVAHSAGRDPLRVDVERLVRRAALEPDGPRVLAWDHARQWHAFHLMAGRSATADRAVAQFGSTLRHLMCADSFAENVVAIHRATSAVALRRTHVRRVLTAGNRPEGA